VVIWFEFGLDKYKVMRINFFRRERMTIHSPEACKKSLIRHLAEISDPRVDRTKAHQLIDILVIGLCAILCGAEHLTDMERFGRFKEKWLREFLELPNGIPSHDTFARVFAALDPEQLRSCFSDWVKEMLPDLAGRHIALDGKKLRRSGEASSGQAAIHMVSAYAHEAGLVLCQRRVDDKSNEITALPDILKILDLTDAIVSIDAMGCQKSIARQITAQGGDYVLSLKGNQGKLAEAVEAHFVSARRDGFELLEHDRYQDVDGGHGRVESRCYDVLYEADWLDPKKEWGGLSAVGCVHSERDAGGLVSRESRYYLLSRRMPARAFAAAVRHHWSIENQVHWVLDMAFREDECRVRRGNSAENLAILRHMALNLLKQDTTVKLGIKSKRLAAGWNNDYLRHLLKGNLDA
jgi:predicted transposase YbfD/YdcC